jgi:hypothetical protein
MTDIEDPVGGQRQHPRSLRCTPAMAAGVTTKLWDLADMVKVLEEWESQHA